MSMIKPGNQPVLICCYFFHFFVFVRDYLDCEARGVNFFGGNRRVLCVGEFKIFYRGEIMRCLFWLSHIKIFFFLILSYSQFNFVKFQLEIILIVLQQGWVCCTQLDDGRTPLSGEKEHLLLQELASLFSKNLQILGHGGSRKKPITHLFSWIVDFRGLYQCLMMGSIVFENLLSLFSNLSFL